MSNSETALMQKIRLALGREPNVRLCRNNCGSLPDPRSGRIVTFGLAKGSADLIGIKRITITPDMVGKHIGVFVSLEVKTGTSRPSPEQIAWLGMVRQFGGIAEIVRSTEDAIKALRIEGTP